MRRRENGATQRQPLHTSTQAHTQLGQRERSALEDINSDKSSGHTNRVYKSAAHTMEARPAFAPRYKNQEPEARERDVGPTCMHCAKHRRPWFNRLIPNMRLSKNLWKAQTRRKEASHKCQPLCTTGTIERDERGSAERQPQREQRWQHAQLVSFPLVAILGDFGKTALGYDAVSAAVWEGEGGPRGAVIPQVTLRRAALVAGTRKGGGACIGRRRDGYSLLKLEARLTAHLRQ